MAPVIVAKDLYKAYPGFPPVLRGVNIDVQAGEMAAIMGPSGCGKSTMLHVLGMLHKPDSGSLEILGQNVLAFNSAQTAAFRRGNMGFVMQASNLFDHSTVFENVEFPLIYENVPPQERWERVIRALDLVRLSARVHYRSNRLSGGEQQRVAIARAMVNNPRILLADEPTGALDARTSRVIMENFRNLCHKGGVAMVMVTHDPKMAEYCDSIYTLEDGLLRCHKHEPPSIGMDASADFLTPPPPLVRGALVAWRFPSAKNRSISQMASRMHSASLLARIYALTARPLAGDQGYSLPLAVRHMGFWRRLLALRIFWRRSRESASIWHIWKRLAKNPDSGSLRRRIRAFASGSVLCRWCLADSIQFLYATGARKESGAAWVAANLLRLPFAFAIQPADFPRLGGECAERAADAAFLTCPTPALRDAFLKRFTSIPAEKVLLLPNPPVFASTEEETDTGSMPPQKGKPADLLAMDGPAYGQLIIAASLLKKRNVPFRLSILGKKHGAWSIRAKGLGKLVGFADREDRLAEDFRLSDIFIAMPPTGPGMELAMPWPVCEAMYFGKPIICLGLTPGMEPLEKDTNCLVVENGAGLAQAIEKLLADRECAARLGASASRAIRNFLDIEGAAKELADRVVMAAGAQPAMRNAEDKNGI